jgi:NTE family protein
MDGGVYDNLALEPVLKRYETLLVSDAGGRMQPEERPKLFWGLQAFRVLTMIDNQVRALRKRDLIELYLLRKKLLDAGMQPQDQTVRMTSRKGSYWSTYADISEYRTNDILDCPHDKTIKLAQLPTRLWSVSQENQERLINWGYAICDAAMRKYVDPKLPANAKFPYVGGVG